MSLVAYGSSDESSDEEQKISNSKPNLSHNLINTPLKRQRESVKITIPSLKEFEDNELEAPVIKKPKMQAGSGLFSLLPPPKNTSTLSKPGFVPHILKSKKEPPTPKENKNYDTGSKTISTSTSVLSDEQDSDDESSSITNKSSTNASIKNDFFWLDDLAINNKSEEVNKSSFILPSKKDTFLQNLPCSTSSIKEDFSQKETNNAYYEQYQGSDIHSFQGDSSGDYESHPYSLPHHSVAESISEIPTQESLLKDKEFLKLQGRKRDLENIDIIDVKADDQLTDKTEWLMKNLTEESTHRPSRKRHDMPTQQQKRKHQITYLAFQAKEREMDLKNQWGLNNRTRRETQAKYGF